MGFQWIHAWFKLKKYICVFQVAHHLSCWQLMFMALTGDDMQATIQNFFKASLHLTSQINVEMAWVDLILCPTVLTWKSGEGIQIMLIFQVIMGLQIKGTPAIEYGPGFIMKQEWWEQVLKGMFQTVCFKSDNTWKTFHTKGISRLYLI